MAQSLMEEPSELTLLQPIQEVVVLEEEEVPMEEEVMVEAEEEEEEEEEEEDMADEEASEEEEEAMEVVAMEAEMTAMTEDGEDEMIEIEAINWMILRQSDYITFLFHFFSSHILTLFYSLELPLIHLTLRWFIQASGLLIKKRADEII
jgi:hypothetical protein